MAADTVTGTVRVAGDAVAGADVLLFGPGEPPALVATATTDAEGAFALDPGGAAGPFTVLTRLTGEVLGVAAREVEGTGPVDLEPAGPARTLTVASQPPHGSLTVALEPEAPAAVPERLRPFVNQRAPGVFAGRFATRALTGEALAVRVLPGTWRIAGESIDPNRPNMPDPGFANVIATAARAEPGGDPLPGDEVAGFALTVDRDRRVTLHLREVGDAEL